ncbi:hypothetical protein Cst_c03990 [Thermoclostridium stercorarium subsp. stercorarium DSM 8532]|uniref:Uncharacterized protein n=1 Tax=Thermoclostridium stercorarium (strain ATCC 35414 / DSM 8532 / NCIMB 11754) TaxID=1121335 RepID=L7VLN8_THES1|nr:hypothetical protein Cst_c03990 [Thermoclostridium stercorarium subsp. stercorarium DSM 8532]
MVLIITNVQNVVGYIISHMLDYKNGEGEVMSKVIIYMRSGNKIEQTLF